MRRRSRATKRRRPNVLQARVNMRFQYRQGSIFVLVPGDARRSRFRIESLVSEFQIDYAVRRHDAVFVFHIVAWAKIDSSAGGFNQEPACGYVPETDSPFDVRIEAAARYISHVERGAAKHAAFTHPMNHLLKQREIRIDHLAGFRQS